MLANEKATPPRGNAKSKSKNSLLETIINSLEDDKAIEKLRDQLKDIAERLRDEGFGKKNAEGMGQSDWVLIDASDAIVHIFRPEVRDYYQLEKMWSADFDDD